MVRRLAGGRRLRRPGGRGSGALLHRHPAAQRDRRADDGARAQQRPAGHPRPAGAAGGPERRCGFRAPTTPASRPRPWWSGSCASRSRPGATSAGKSSSSGSGPGGRRKATSSWSSCGAWAAPATGTAPSSPWTRCTRGRCSTAFVELFRRGQIYRGKRMVNWCPASQTALSDEEVIMKPVNGALYQVRYELADRPGRIHPGGDDPPGDDPGRRGDRRAPGRSPLCGAGRPDGLAAAQARPDPDHRRRGGRPGVRLGRAQDHARPRQGRL